MCIRDRHFIERLAGKFRQFTPLSPIVEIVVFHETGQAIYHQMCIRDRDTTGWYVS